MAKFYGKSFDNIKPGFTGEVAQGKPIILPKGLPALPKPVLIAGNMPANIPTTSEIIGLNDLRASGTSYTGKGLCAVVIDSGVSEHENLAGAILMRLSANGNAKDVNDKYGHGTHMAGIITGRPLFSGIGIAKAAKIISIKVTRSSSGEATWSSITRALKMVIELLDAPPPAALRGHKISVVNLSFNGLDSLSQDYSRSYHTIFKQIEVLKKRKIPVVISVGNYYEKFKGWQDGLGYPACNSNSINVAASYNYSFDGFLEKTLATFSQRYYSDMVGIVPVGVIKKEMKNFILAPGACSVSLSISKQPKFKYSYISGTSSAAAVVTGCVLLLQDAAMNKYGSLPTVAKIKSWLRIGSEVQLNRRSAASSPISGILATVSIGAGTRLPPPTKFFDNKIYCGINIKNSIDAV